LYGGKKHLGGGKKEGKIGSFWCFPDPRKVIGNVKKGGGDGGGAERRKKKVCAPRWWWREWSG